MPPSIGGTDADENLQPQEGFFHRDYHPKDRLEDRVCDMVCRDQTICLRAGQAMFMGDWIAAYQQVFGKLPPSQ